jgi:hypothetical protein
MADEAAPVAIKADAVSPTRPGRGYPEPFASRVAGRVRRALGDAFGLTHFGVNLTRLLAGGMSALRHTHRSEDEFVTSSKATLFSSLTRARPRCIPACARGSGPARATPIT